MLVDFGVIGGMAYIACIIYMAKHLKSMFGRSGYAMPVAVIVGYSLSTFLGLELNYFFIICIMLMKIYEFYGKENEEESDS